jgi:phage baseplate assembly protein W
MSVGYKTTPFTRSDKFTELINKPVKFSDIAINLDVHPNTGDLIRITNENSIKKQMKNLLLTNKYERPFMPSYGCSIRSILFENLTDQTALIIKDIITEAVKNHMPHVRVLAVQVIPIDQGVSIEIVFVALNIEGNQTLSFYLDRVR